LPPAPPHHWLGYENWPLPHEAETEFFLLSLLPGLPDFSWYNKPKWEKIPNGHEIHQIFSFQSFQKYTKIGI
jgi:hypothetical protein